MSLEHIKNRFNAIENDDLFKLESWILHEPYVIINLQMVESKFGPCILATLTDAKGHCFKSYLPGRFAKTLTEDDIDIINESTEKLALVCEGKTTSGKSYRIKLV